jgi:2-C-methyl-D-erythritol 4-phosphate cytidylyltransferase
VSPTRDHALADRTWAIVVAAGSGARFGGDQPKQYVELGGRRVLDWSLQSLGRWFGARIVLVVAADRLHDVEAGMVGVGAVVAGGATRSDSVRAGLAAVPSDAEAIFVHDAARPLIDDDVVTALLAAIEGGADGAIPGVPVTDTVKRVDGTNTVVETLRRPELVAVQTPQAFRALALRRVHVPGAEATDDAALIEAAGGVVVVVPGSERLRKVTTSADLAFLEGLLAHE